MNGLCGPKPTWRLLGPTPGCRPKRLNLGGLWSRHGCPAVSECGSQFLSCAAFSWLGHRLSQEIHTASGSAPIAVQAPEPAKQVKLDALQHPPGWPLQSAAGYIRWEHMQRSSFVQRKEWRQRARPEVRWGNLALLPCFCAVSH